MKRYILFRRFEDRGLHYQQILYKRITFQNEFKFDHGAIQYVID